MKPHRTDMVSLTFAVIFLAIFGWWVVSRLVNLHVPAAGWWVAFGLILLGLLGLIGAVRSTRNATVAHERAAAEAARATGSPAVADDAVDPYPSMDVDRPTADLGEPVSSPPRRQTHE